MRSGDRLIHAGGNPDNLSDRRTRADGCQAEVLSVYLPVQVPKIKVRFNFLPGKTAPEGLRFDFRERKVDWCVGRSFVASDTLHPAASLTFAASLADQIGATEGDFPTLPRISGPTP
jgi:hypothetical protein